MKLRKYLVFIAFIACFSLLICTSCTYDNKEELLKDFQCDTSNIVYNDLTYIFTGICTTCHNIAYTERDEILMDNYGNVKSSINTGLVLPAIKHVGPNNMPDDLPKLSDCDINKIETWINNGMPEN